MKIFCVTKGCKLKSIFVLAEDITKYRNIQINYRQIISSIDIQDVSRIHRKLKSLVHGIILRKQCYNNVSSIMIGFRACIQKTYAHII
jgi:hypothetical protein